jgi:hypothetical protein
MPRRMLRHRVIQQCARLALGISAIEGPSKVETPKKETSTKENLITKALSRKQTDILKENLTS